MSSAANSNLGTIDSSYLLKHSWRCISEREFAAILANNHLFSFNSKALFDIATCACFKEADQIWSQTLALFDTFLNDGFHLCNPNFFNKAYILFDFLSYYSFCNQIYYISFLIAKWFYKSFYGADKLLSILCFPFPNSLWQLMVAFSCCLWISSHFIDFFLSTVQDRLRSGRTDFMNFHSVLCQQGLQLLSSNCWFVPKHDPVLYHKRKWCFIYSVQLDFHCWILTIFLDIFFQAVTSLLDIGESPWHNWACPVRKSAWLFPLKQRDTMLNCQSAHL